MLGDKIKLYRENKKMTQNDTPNNSDNLFNDSILGSKAPDSYFETVPALTSNISAISF